MSIKTPLLGDKNLITNGLICLIVGFCFILFFNRFYKSVCLKCQPSSARTVVCYRKISLFMEHCGVSVEGLKCEGKKVVLHLLNYVT